MPFLWRINITKNPQPGKPAVFTFEESPPQVMIGDQVFWSNQDSVPHWPGLAGDDQALVSNQIAAHSTSAAFAPGKVGAINYVCSLHPEEKGAIVVLPTPPEEEDEEGEE